MKFRLIALAACCAFTGSAFAFPVPVIAGSVQVALTDDEGPHPPSLALTDDEGPHPPHVALPALG